MSKHKKNKHYQHQHFTPHSVPVTESADDGDWVPVMKFKMDKGAMSRRLEEGIPPLLAMIVPSDMEISAIETRSDEAMYIVRQVVACGTVEDIVDHLAARQGTMD